MEHTLRMAIQWSEEVKLILLIAAAVVFAASLTLLVLESIGKKKQTTLHVAYTEEPVPAPADEAVEVAPAQEETPAEVAEPAAAETAADDTTRVGETFVIDGKTIYVRYNRSFSARLIQSSDEVKARYSELKNVLLAYGTKARMSWTNETFRVGRGAVAKFGIKGKTLSIYLALDPVAYEESKYIFENVGNTKRYEQVPLRLKLRSNRSVKWAKELIAAMMAGLGLEMADREPESFAPPFETTEALVYRGLIKVLVTGDGAETELTAATFEAMRREKFQQATGLDFKESVTVEAEASLTNEMAAAFIEDEETAEQPAPAAEPAIVEEPAALPDSPAEVAEPAPKQAEAVPAPAPAAQKPAARAKSSSAKKPPKAIVNIDTIGEAFDAGETVSLDTLKAKGLIPKKAISVKVLARGVLNKPLTVIADVYSMQAVKMILLTGGRVIKKSHKN